MSREAAVAVVLGVFVLIVAVAVAGGLVGGSVTTEVADDQPPAATVDGVVYLLREEPRTRILGFEFGTRRSIGVTFEVDAACADALAGGESWPPAAGGCADDLDIAGAIELTGRTPAGVAILGVVFEVERACFDSVEVGVAWSDVRGVCTGD